MAQFLYLILSWGLGSNVNSYKTKVKYDEGAAVSRSDSIF